MTFQDYIHSIQSSSVAVIGAGVSNTPLIRKLLESGCSDVTVCDKRTIEQMGDLGNEILALGGKLSLGDAYLDDLYQDIIFRTPGVMPFEPHLAAASARGAVITSEMELFFRFCPCRFIAVTGSDGKTTTTTIISELLKAAGYRVHLGGNIGTPLLCGVDEIDPNDFAVLELSSFQLHSMDCRPNVAVITNISPNHLDKHKDYQDYIDAKAFIFRNQQAGDILVLNSNDEQSSYYAAQSQSQLRYFSLDTPAPNAVFLEGQSICSYFDGVKCELLSTTDIALPGIHNVLNYMAAYAATADYITPEVFANVARSFQGVEHRLETVRTLHGVRYINDSIGTSPTRTIAGLHALPEKPIIILGGYDKHIPFDGLGDELCVHAKMAILTGDTALKIKAAIENSSNFASSELQVVLIDDFSDAVQFAAKAAKSGDIVLLSPACAAFDRFKNFMERGKRFKSLVMELN